MTEKQIQKLKEAVNIIVKSYNKAMNEHIIAETAKKLKTVAFTVEKG